MEKLSYFIRNGIVINYILNTFATKHHIVEVGCREGVLANTLLNYHYKNLTLIDIEDNLSPRIKKQIQFQKCDVSFAPIPLATQSQDAIIATQVVEHLENPFFFFREAKRVLKEKGQLIISIPHIFSIRSKIDFLLHGDLHRYNEHNDHIALFTKAVFQKTVLKNFKIFKTIYSRGYIKIRHRKIYLPDKFNKYFGNCVLFIMEVKN